MGPLDTVPCKGLLDVGFSKGGADLNDLLSLVDIFRFDVRQAVANTGFLPNHRIV